MTWIFLAFTTAVFLGVYSFFIKISSGYINQIAGAVILQAVAILVGGIGFLILKFTGNVIEISRFFGGPENLKEAVTQLQNLLYAA